MILMIRSFFMFLLLGIVLEAANVNVTTYYGKTGGIVGILNTTTQVVNGRTICPENPTIGCDFGDNPLFSNSGTVNDPSDDTYSGDLIVRTNDSFQAVAGWTWNGVAGGTEEKLTIRGTLPAMGILPDGSDGPTGSYKWDTLPGSCDATESSISADKQTMICVRKDFDKNDVGTYSEDLPFNVIVKGETLSRTKPGDVTFEVSAENAVAVSDDTDGYSLTVTAAPRWNLQKSMYTYITGQTIDGVVGWVMDYKFYIEVDEVDGELDNASALVGNESMGSDATFTFRDDISEIAPNAKLIECSMNGRYTNRDGYVGSTDPTTFNGAESIYGDGVYPERKIPQAKGIQTISCSQSGTDIAIQVDHVDATLTNYPTQDYAGRALPVNRGIAAIGSIYIFVPLDDVKPIRLGGRNPENEGWLTTKNHLFNFDPITPTGNANFGGERESELDNHKNYTLYYNRGSFDKYYRGDSKGVWEYPGGALGYRSGDGLATQGYEFSTTLVTNNTGGSPFLEEKVCDVVDAYRLDIQDIEDNQYYNIIKTYYAAAYHINSRPIMYHIWNGEGNYTNQLADEPYEFEYASTYEDNSWLPSRGGSQTVSHKLEIETECNAVDSKWFSTADAARVDANGIGAVTKVRMKLRAGVEHNPGAYVYWWLNHKVRATDLETGQPLENGDEITNFSAYSFNGNDFTGAGYITQNYPEPAESTLGDRITFTGPKVRVIKNVDKVALSAGDEATFNLKISFTNDTGLEEYGNVKVTDLLPKGFKYLANSITEPYVEPTFGTCDNVTDINATETPCVDGVNQVLIWDLGNRQANEIFPDINYTTIVGVEVNAGTVRNVVKIESPTDASQVSQRRAEVGMSVTIPASINIVKNTEENADYPSPRERTLTAKNIDFIMDMRNGKAGDITDLDVIDILPFVGDGDVGAIKFNDLELSRKVPTDFHGTMSFATMELIEHALSSTACDVSANRGVKYYYTGVAPKTINIAPTVGVVNDVNNANTIWCQGDENGPNGCNGLTNTDVTAVRARGPRMEAQAICQLKMSLTVNNNLAGDNYSNSTGASATGITLPVLSNSLAVPVVGSSLGDTVWYDKNADGIQDESENGIAGVIVHLLDEGGVPVKNPVSPTDDYVVTTDAEGKYAFSKLNAGNYIVSFEQPTGYLLSDKQAGVNTSVDSDINSGTSQTDPIALGVDVQDLSIDAGFYTPTISGNIFNDGNNDGTVNGTGISTPSGTQLYVSLLDENGALLSSKAVTPEGNYSFDGDDQVVANSNYTVVLSTTRNSIIAELPTNWLNGDGEHLGTSAGLDNLVDGKLSVSVASENVEQANFGIYYNIAISGHLYNDGNGDGNVNGTAISSADGTQLYANLLDASGNFVSSKPFSRGSYLFDSADGVEMNSNYTVVLTSDPIGQVGLLPTEWSNNDGEAIGVNALNDGDQNGEISVSVLEEVIPEINFGINKKPVAVDVVEPTQANPGVDTQIAVPDLNMSDSESTDLSVTITTLPTTGTLYYNGTPVVVNQVISRFDNTLLTVDPNSGNQSLTFDYVVTDAAGVHSNEATATMDFTDIVISGTLFNDGNGNGNVDGNVTNNADEIALYVTLVKNAVAVASKLLAIDGTYNFKSVDGVERNTDYTVILSDEANSTVAKLPRTWGNQDGENIGLIGLDRSADGINMVSVLTDDIPEINFGINKQPFSPTLSEPEQFNPGLTTQVAVPDLNVSDKEDIQPSIITITELPTNATLYYDGNPVVAGAEIPNVDPSKFTLDPLDGDLTAIFTYTSTDRAGVISETATVTMPFKALQISGNIFNDGDNDGTVNGTGISEPNGEQLYATLMNANGDLLASKEINGDGTYSFGNRDGILPNSIYTIVLSTALDGTAPSLPVNWSNLDGEHIGTDVGDDGDDNGVIAVSVATSNIEEVNFGINKKPVAGDVTEPLQLNPGNSVHVNVPDLNITDNEDNTPRIVTVKSVPTHGVLYYNGAVVTVGQVINNLDNTLLTIDPENGDRVLSFTYTTTDAVGDESDVATVSMSFDGLEIRGNVFDDGNHDETVNGSAIALVEGLHLYATLLDENSNVMISIPLENDGSYLFDGEDGIVPNTNYSVVVSTEINATTSTLPINWNHEDGEHIGTNQGLDGTNDGLIVVPVVEVDVPEVNFGINQQPLAEDNNASERLNPGQTTQVVVPNLEVTDKEDGTPPSIKIRTLATNGTLYYDGVAVTLNQVIENFDNSKLKVDPIDGNTVVEFDYASIDKAGFESHPAHVTMPFRGLEISGHLFDDGNNNGNIDGESIGEVEKIQLFVNLLTARGQFIASQPLSEDGNYSFDGNATVTANTQYKLVLTMESNGTIAKLPEGWNNADGENVGLNGTDGQSDGSIVINTVEVNVPEINFGINHNPLAENKRMPSRLNVGADVPVGTLNISDKEDGIPTTITIKSLPSGGILYYDGIEVTVDQNITDFDNTLLTVKPNFGGTPTLIFNFTVTDRVGVESNVAQVVVPFTGLSISGNIYADGNSDGDVNGEGISIVNEEQLYVTLLTSGGGVLASHLVSSDGSYSFDSVDGVNPLTQYSIVLSTTSRGRSASLPNNWNHADGENIGVSGTDGSADGAIVVSLSTTNITQINFGINEQPIAKNVETKTQANPGAERQVPVVALEGVDNEDGIPRTVTITTLPNAGILYYNGIEVSEGQVIPNFDNGLLTVDPQNGEQVIVFTYTTTDTTGWESEPARVRMPFSAVAAEENFNILDDEVRANPNDPTTAVNVLGNDELGEGNTIKLIDQTLGAILWSDGTAVGGTSIDTVDEIVVPGEGTWRVVDGRITFTSEPGFNGVPTPIYYVVLDENGNQSNVAQVAITSSCYCEPYVESLSDSVDALDERGMIIILLLTSLLSLFFIRRELAE